MEELQQELEETRQQLQTAAEFGSMLLEKNQSLEAEKGNLENLLSGKDKENITIKSQLEQQSRINIELQRKLEVNENQAHSELESEIKSLTSKYQTSMEQVQQLSTANNQLQSEVEEKNNMLVKYRGIDKEYLQQRKEYEAYVLLKEELDKKLEKAENEKTELKRNQSDLKVKLKKAEESYDKLQLENSELQMKINQKGNSDKGRVNQLIRELEEADETIDELEKTLGDVKYEKKQLERTVADFAVQNQQLNKERDENQQFLEEARKSLAKLRKKAEEKEMEALMNAPGIDLTPKEEIEEEEIKQEDEDKEEEMDKEEEIDDSLGALEHQIESRIHKDELTTKKSPPPDAPENCEEFFFLSATAIKISFAVQAPRSSDGCFKMNIRTLYQQALEQEVPFHEWYDWIKLQLASKQEPLMSSLAPSPARTPANSSNVVDRVNKKPIANRQRMRKNQPRKSSWFGWLG